MGRYDRSIKVAFDKTTGEILRADEVFEKTKDGFQIRKEFHQRIKVLSCVECEQTLNVSSSLHDCLHFKHEPNSDPCIFKGGRLSPKETDLLNATLAAKESPRHHELKNLIGERLAKVDGVDPNSILIDSQFIVRNGEKRRPDVYCKYKDKELVFEIQLSQLSLKYILNRYEFYRKNGMYLVWILDNFDIHNQGTLEKDIKYLTVYQNYFKLDESKDQFSLHCEYKKPFITNENKIHTPWNLINVPLEKINFDETEYQIYFYDFYSNQKKLEVELENRMAAIRTAEINKLQEEVRLRSNPKVEKIIKLMEDYYKENKYSTYTSLVLLFEKLDSKEIEVLNRRLSLKTHEKNDMPILNYWLRNSKKHHFVKFILKNTLIELDVNTTYDGFSTLIESDLNDPFDEHFDLLLFERGYKLKDIDYNYFRSTNHLPTIEKWILYTLINKINDTRNIRTAFFNSKILYTIESIKQKNLISYNYQVNPWVNLANNFIYHRPEYWTYIELAFKEFGLWETLLADDKNKSFYKKFNDYLNINPLQKYDLDEVIKDIYPELFSPPE